MTTNLEERAREFVDTRLYMTLNQESLVSDITSLLTQVQAEARLAALEEAAQWLEANHRDDEDEQWEACCNLPDKIRALAHAAALAKEMK